MNKTEKKTLSTMIYIYCAAKHGTTSQLCAECDELNAYAQKRLKYCKFGKNKPICRKCPVHCYKPEMRTRIQAVMRFSGFRMIFRSPLLTLKHLMQFR